MRAGAALLALALLHAGAARAVTRRVAVVVGNNAGQGDRTPLRFAEADAGKMARVLAEVGGVAPADLFLLQGQTRGALAQALELARARVDLGRRSPADRVLLFFYFSGHSDGAAIELGREAVTFGELRGLLARTGADVRVVVVDSCRSGALLAMKGGAPGPTYDIRLTEDLEATGQVLLTSSAADEVSLESADLGGSVFTHYLASGLRGAADTSGDGRVTLMEAYHYAYQGTLSSTAATSFGVQHPSFDYRLSGQGELVLADLDAEGNRETAWLVLPDGLDRVVINDLRRDQVVAELGPGAGRRIAVSAGAYAVRALRAGQAYLARVTVAAGEHRSVTLDELQASAGAVGLAKGGELVRAYVSPDPPLTIALLGGVQTGLTVGAGLAGQISVAGRDGLGPRLGLSFGAGGRAGVEENVARALVSWAFGLKVDRFVLFVAPAAGAGLVWQSLGNRSVLGELAGQAGASMAVGRRVAVVVEGQLGAALVQENNIAVAALDPQAWVGLRTRFRRLTT